MSTPEARKARQAEKLAAVSEVLGQIEANREDDERAHGMQDALYEHVLRVIATDAELTGRDCAELAAEALKSADIEFARRCA